MTLSRYKTILTISLPLVLSMGATTVMEFTDRVFLGNYDLNSLAAATPAGMTMKVKIGIASRLPARPKPAMRWK